MGADIEKPFETMPLEPYEGNIEYIAVQYIVMGNVADFKSEDVYGFHIGIADSHQLLESHRRMIVTTNSFQTGKYQL